MPTLKRRTYRQKKDKGQELGYKKSKNWESFYGSKAWHNLRNWKIKEFPLCECCLMNGVATPATEVHHKLVYGTLKTKEAKWNAFLNPDLLASLCNYHHHLAHKYLKQLHTNYLDIDTIVKLEEQENYEKQKSLSEA